MKKSIYQHYKDLCQLEHSSIVDSSEKCIEFSPNVWDNLAPFKVEFHSYDPLVLTFHDVLPEDKMDNIREQAVNRLSVPKSYSSVTGSVRSNGARTGKVGFIPEGMEFIEALANRLTGMATEENEALQVVSYGIGGHYEPHVDFFNHNLREENHFVGTNSGDRIATLLFYLNDVTAGGATVFPRIGISVRPIKGSAPSVARCWEKSQKLVVWKVVSRLFFLFGIF